MEQHYFKFEYYIRNYSFEQIKKVNKLKWLFIYTIFFNKHISNKSGRFTQLWFNTVNYHKGVNVNK